MTEVEKEAVVHSSVAVVAEASHYLQLFSQALAIAIRTRDDKELRAGSTALNMSLIRWKRDSFLSILIIMVEVSSHSKKA